MNKIYFFITLCIIFLLPGCAVLESHDIQKPEVNFANICTLQLPTPATLDLHLSAVQILTAHTIRKTYTTQVVLEISSNHIILVAPGVWGGQLFSIDYDGKRVKSSHLPIKHGGVGIQQTLLDVILAYSPTPVLENMLRGKQIKLTVRPLVRVFSFHGKPIIKIQYQYENPWRGKVNFKNFSQHYRINITTINVDKK
ncbi:MAG: hypothetical protein A3I77_01535 [Gammaproteobacteria bacterium RIFCSPLOWO2_02_FULL_42_14]|nr:MAG: hypothetical protein A3B71_07720 [Gammaproteobacteria bacterium RIFCSPHIGHO2_02_FULL_42_43]OGT27379.1 MAG: hypothetical protein A2624_05720 [Gammaproteobacteria bacterium RIFCSPHIGHO2_01_FULL_42_8]OGT52306.1 MAG: hypothetical protein A3E54_01595 [Gammaproteobacteria bacterium RIFCSPHIGHO2_12_FULL_41_25]OGT61918.1 MAG: hypothetical protein A3I77_01535 [Gammaproteobacteria bacterium RIFCSPLOWO2_02_FULL_42_14]OGT86371.1 MAG: hypothetical protein A3G86_07560 [Gammaproteobacteria bacterium R